MGKKFKIIFGFLMIAFGVGLYAYPIATTTYQAYETKQYIKKYDAKWEEKSKGKSALLKEIEQYNKKIYKTGQKEFCDAWSYTQSPVSLDGLKDGEYGYIEIPKMEVKLPLYIGASEENLRKGAAILGQTSIPIGGKNQNSVIAGHRGYQGAPYFREIEKLSPGDKVIIKNPWETLTYHVTSFAIINPDDTDAVKIEKGKDMVTLVTCHPYRSHGKYRYVVYCSREKTGQEGVDKNKVFVSTQIKFKSSQPDIQREKIVRFISALILCFICVLTLKNIFVTSSKEK